MSVRWEQLGDGKLLATTPSFKFGTDAVVLTAFAAAKRSSETVCELGTGCGVIPFLLYGRSIVPNRVLAVDVQEEAITLCEASLAKNPPFPITFQVGDWYDPKSIGDAGTFDTVICNPPYFLDGSGKQNDDIARKIARHAKPDTLSAVCKTAAFLLKYGGRVCLCHRPAALSDLLFHLQQAGLTPKRVQTVQQKADSDPFLILVEGVKGGKVGLSLPAPWILDDPDIHQAIYGKYR
jgi:tRNA1(Val) A37 N6-methylase TrmN6